VTKLVQQSIWHNFGANFFPELWHISFNKFCVIFWWEARQTWIYYVCWKHRSNL